MSIKVLVVDDSSFFRRRVTEILNRDSQLEVVDVAVNGKEAIEKAKKIRPDVITMDVEMPVLDGISAVREIMKNNPVPILMFSSLTHKGASATLDALEAGAVDFLPKKFEDIARDKVEAADTLQQRVKAIARSRGRSPIRAKTTTIERSQTVAPSTTRSSTTLRENRTPITTPITRSLSRTKSETTRTATRLFDKEETLENLTLKDNQHYDLLAIGTSTGGPVALQQILTAFPKDYPHPILLIQHMPSTFTTAFAARLDSLCQIHVKEAESGDVLKAGVAYLAPGGKQMMVEGKAINSRIKIIEDNSPRITYKPSVDITFGSAAKVFNNKVLAVVLTGMGADGREGAKLLKKNGATIWAQDEETSVVYGMPQAIAVAGLSDIDGIPLPEVAGKILREVGYG